MRLNYIPRRNIFEAVNYGYLYNWYAAAQPQSVEYGYLYNWYAATDVRDIANTGWHTPSQTEYQVLADYLGAGGNYSTNTAGGLLKETGTVYWTSPNTGATNSSRFNARGAGYRQEGGLFTAISGLTPNDLRLHTATSVTSSSSMFSRMQYGNDSFFCGTNTSISKKQGGSIRLLKDSTALTHGQTGTYVGNDGRAYRTICIGTQEWLSENLMETKYQNGDAIPEVTDNTTWAGLTTGARCSYNNLESNAVVDTEIANVGWSVPTTANQQLLATYLGGESVAGGKLKEIGFTYWDSPNTGATNETVFNGRGSGGRSGVTGIFSNQKTKGSCWSKDSQPEPSIFADVAVLSHDLETFSVTSIFAAKKDGRAMRLVKDSTTLSHGEAGTYTGNDGKIYRTICIGTQEWLADNLAESKFRDGSSIPIVEDNAAWSNLTTAGMCAYNNDYNNV